MAVAVQLQDLLFRFASIIIHPGRLTYCKDRPTMKV
jgi:hypothetical protein